MRNGPGTLLERVSTKVEAGERITREEGVGLLGSCDLLALGHLATKARWRIHPNRVVSYVVDRNINYTNICVTRCRFCAFSRKENTPDAYLNSHEIIGKKIEETLARGGTGILLQGGHHPSLRLDYYVELLRYVKENYTIHVHGFSPPEIRHVADLMGMPVREVLCVLREAGLDSIPGGGAEILDERSRNRISPKKCTVEEWLEVMREAHLLGIPSTATMMFGHGETLEERVSHLERVRSLQDETGGFTAFIAWTFQERHTAMEGEVQPAFGVDYLRTQAVARVYLDNFANIQSSWVTQGPKVGQLALHFGANDLGSIMMEENVVSAAGASWGLTEPEMRRLIREAGFLPVKRTTLYRYLGPVPLEVSGRRDLRPVPA